MTAALLRFVRWFTPGLGVKRWLLLAAFGCVLLVNGITRWLVAEAAHLPLNEMVDSTMADFGVPLSWLSYLFAIFGVVFIFFGIRQWMR